MKKVLIFILVCLWSNILLAQTVSIGKQEIDKTNLEGLYITTGISDKHIGKYWEKYLQQYGKVNSSRGGVYKVPQAAIPTISAANINVISKVSTTSGRSQIFAHLDLGGGVYVSQDAEGYESAKTFLAKFIDYATALDEVRIAEEAMKEAEKKFNKLTNTGEDIKKDIEKTNQKLAQLKVELDVNQQEINTSKADLSAKQKAFDEAKAKSPENW